jgi:hypothetical protein
VPRSRSVTATSAHATAGVAALGVLVVASIAVAGTPGAAAPRCFGAAARDPVRPCVNPTKTVFGLDNPRRPASARCRPVAESPVAYCSFGAPAARAKATFAVVGDSHAVQWRPALSIVARAERWRGLSVTTSGCYFSAASEHFPGADRESCTTWYRSVLAWFGDHPEVSTVFVTQHAATQVAVGPGETSFGIKTAGFRSVWRALPKTVKHVIVLRDVPQSTNPQFNCVDKVVAEGKERPGPACPLARATALKPDAAVATVRLLHSPRYQSADLTEFFCDGRSCYPVIGGVLVHFDVDHITAAYSATLGPYVLRKVRKHMA